MSQDPEILVPARTGVDILVLAIALPLAAFTLGCGLYFLIFPDSAPAADGVRVPFLSKSASDLAVICGALAAVTVWLCARGFGALWRALDRRQMLVADADGLTFHPALCAEVVPWRDVRRIRGVGWRRPYDLAIELRRRIWAIEAPLTARRVRIGGLYMGNSGFVPHELLARLEDLRNATRASGRDQGLS